jgi:plasmid replication initiation protein
MTQNIFPNCYASLESTFKMMKNGLNNLFTAHNFTIIVLRWQQKEEYLISLKWFNEIKKKIGTVHKYT